jgi:hypothetical protein
MSEHFDVEDIIKSFPSLSEEEIYNKLGVIHKYCQTEKDGYLVLLSFIF